LFKCFYNPTNLNVADCALISKNSSDRDFYDLRTTGEVIFLTLSISKPQFSVGARFPSWKLPSTQPPIKPTVKVEEYWEVQFGYDIETRFRQNMLTVEEEWACPGASMCPGNANQKRTITCYSDWIATSATRKSMPWKHSYLKQLP